MVNRNARGLKIARIIAVIAILHSAACEHPASRDLPSNGSQQDVQLPMTAAGAVISRAKARGVLKQCSRRTPWVKDFWVPSASVVAEVENSLPAYVDSAAAASVELRRGVWEGRYYRQYIGIVRWNGKQTVYINAFERTYVDALNDARRAVARQQGQASFDTVSWRTIPITVCDGGQMFFGVEYDTAMNRFYQFRTNAAASGG